MTVVVFLGPSLDRASARALLPDAILLPPAAQADLLSAIGTYKPDVIGLVDGSFGQSQSVWHKEILFALSEGVAVVGAASMGALRAAELEPYGMQGLGEVYRLFSCRELEDDDEVAVAHGSADEGFRPMSEPMVNLRATLRWAGSADVLTTDVCSHVLNVAKNLHFSQRSILTILQQARLDEPTACRVRDVFASHYIDIKRADAELLLRALHDRRYSTPPRIPRPGSAPFERLYQEDRRVRLLESEIPLRTIASHAALNLGHFDELNFAALNRSLAQMLARLLEVQPDQSEIAAEARRFRRERGLLQQADLDAWLRANHLSHADWESLLVELATCRRLQRRVIAMGAPGEQTRSLLNELRLRAEYTCVAEHAVSEAARTRSIERPSVAELSETELQTLVSDRLSASRWRLNTSLRDWAEEAGFRDLKDLAYELLRTRHAGEDALAAEEGTHAATAI
ncbi:MAG: hypothetical protein JOZ81_01785 [Chloroflexi bacterium]|nr:hypothetical protein [Chloroflexota bacterium]